MFEYYMVGDKKVTITILNYTKCGARKVFFFGGLGGGGGGA